MLLEQAGEELSHRFPGRVGLSEDVVVMLRKDLGEGFGSLFLDGTM